MNRELMENWIAALRSGKYKQGQEYLFQADEDGEPCYCCLGVLQDIEPRIEEEADGAEILDDDTLRKFLGVGDADGFDQSKYAKMNDAGVPFLEIADRLEQEWLKKEDK